MTGYTVATTTYTGTAETVTCATGYTGTPDPASATCGTDGSWSDSSFTGCTLHGRYQIFMRLSDCKQLTVIGYTVATTTYTGTAEIVTSATGYTGTLVPASATCATDGL